MENSRISETDKGGELEIEGENYTGLFFLYK